ncbi:c-type cytochrome [Paracoccus cavernae]
MMNRSGAQGARPGNSMEAQVPAKLFGRTTVLAITSAVTMTFASSSTIVAAGFTAEQATAGQTEYQSNCAQCHGVRLEGPEAPGLFGQDVMGNWDTAGGLYEFISVAMPPAQPGQLGEPAYLNIVAYIMQQNGAEAGDTALTTADMANVGLVAETKDGAAQLALANQETDIEAGDTNVPQAFTWGKELPQFKN